MSKYSVYTTQKGTELPLMNLKGKPYMMVAHRLVWFTEDVPNYETSTEFLLLSESATVAKVTVTIFSTELDSNGNPRIVKKVSATKREDSKGFADHTEKAETGALGRALALAGYGTQFAIADLDEENRLADSPVTVVKTEAKVETAPAQTEAPKKRFGGFASKAKPTGDVS